MRGLCFDFLLQKSLVFDFLDRENVCLVVLDSNQISFEPLEKISTTFVFSTKKNVFTCAQRRQEML